MGKHWADREDVLYYIIDCYQGVELDGSRIKRQFMWEESNGDVFIGNSRAFTDHLSIKFDLHLPNTAWITVHRILRAVGEIAQVHSPRVVARGKKFRNQEPEQRLVRRGNGHESC